MKKNRRSVKKANTKISVRGGRNTRRVLPLQQADYPTVIPNQNISVVQTPRRMTTDALVGVDPVAVSISAEMEQDPYAIPADAVQLNVVPINIIALPAHLNEVLNKTCYKKQGLTDVELFTIYRNTEQFQNVSLITPVVNKMCERTKAMKKPFLRKPRFRMFNSKYSILTGYLSNIPDIPEIMSNIGKIPDYSLYDFVRNGSHISLKLFLMDDEPFQNTVFVFYYCVNKILDVLYTLLEIENQLRTFNKQILFLRRSGKFNSIIRAIELQKSADEQQVLFESAKRYFDGSLREFVDFFEFCQQVPPSQYSEFLTFTQDNSQFIQKRNVG